MARVLVSFEDTLLRKVDRAARTSGLTRSAYLAQLVERDAAKREGPGKSAAVHTALGELDELFAGTPYEDSTEAIRAGRGAR